MGARAILDFRFWIESAYCLLPTAGYGHRRLAASRMNKILSSPMRCNPALPSTLTILQRCKVEPTIALSFRSRSRGRGISLGVTRKEGQGEIPLPRLRDRNDSPALVNASNRFMSTRLLTVLLACAMTCLTFLPAEAAAKPGSQSLPAGYVLYLRLEATISTTASHLHDVVKARIIREVDSGNRVLIPLGAEVQGRIEKLIPSSSATDRARLLIRFDKLIIPDNPAVTFAGHISEVENARENVLQDGTIWGVLASDLPVSHLEDTMRKLAGEDSELSKYGQKAFGKSDTSINYGAGTDLTLVLDKPLSLAEMPPSGSFNQLPPGVPDAVARMLQGAPQRASGKGGKPGDPLNLVVIGNISEIRDVFSQAGWGEAERKTGKAVWDTARAVADNQGFGRAPVSDLYLFGHREDLAFEKVLNTFLKRHHLRLWRTTGTTPEGREIWLGAATHDTGLDVHPGVVSHAIDPDLDAERAKVGADLRVTGRVAAEGLVTRPDPLSQGLTATGGTWKTDGQLLVIDLATP